LNTKLFRKWRILHPLSTACQRTAKKIKSETRKFKQNKKKKWTHMKATLLKKIEIESYITWSISRRKTWIVMLLLSNYIVRACRVLFLWEKPVIRDLYQVSYKCPPRNSWRKFKNLRKTSQFENRNLNLSKKRSKALAF